MRPILPPHARYDAPTAEAVEDHVLEARELFPVRATQALRAIAAGDETLSFDLSLEDLRGITDDLLEEALSRGERILVDAVLDGMKPPEAIRGFMILRERLGFPGMIAVEEVRDRLDGAIEAGRVREAAAVLRQFEADPAREERLRAALPMRVEKLLARLFHLYENDGEEAWEPVQEELRAILADPGFGLNRASYGPAIERGLLEGLKRGSFHFLAKVAELVGEAFELRAFSARHPSEAMEGVAAAAISMWYEDDDFSTSVETLAELTGILPDWNRAPVRAAVEREVVRLLRRPSRHTARWIEEVLGLANFRFSFVAHVEEIRSGYAEALTDGEYGAVAEIEALTGIECTSETATEEVLGSGLEQLARCADFSTATDVEAFFRYARRWSPAACAPSACERSLCDGLVRLFRKAYGSVFGPERIAFIEAIIREGGLRVDWREGPWHDAVQRAYARIAFAGDDEQPVAFQEYVGVPPQPSSKAFRAELIALACDGLVQTMRVPSYGTYLHPEIADPRFGEVLQEPEVARTLQKAYRVLMRAGDARTSKLFELIRTTRVAPEDTDRLRAYLDARLADRKTFAERHRKMADLFPILGYVPDYKGSLRESLQAAMRDEYQNADWEALGEWEACTGQRLALEAGTAIDMSRLEPLLAHPGVLAKIADYPIPDVVRAAIMAKIRHLLDSGQHILIGGALEALHWGPETIEPIVVEYFAARVAKGELLGALYFSSGRLSNLGILREALQPDRIPLEARARRTIDRLVRSFGSGEFQVDAYCGSLVGDRSAAREVYLAALRSASPARPDLERIRIQTRISFDPRDPEVLAALPAILFKHAMDWNRPGFTYVVRVAELTGLLSMFTSEQRAELARSYGREGLPSKGYDAWKDWAQTIGIEPDFTDQGVRAAVARDCVDALVYHEQDVVDEWEAWSALELDRSFLRPEDLRRLEAYFIERATRFFGQPKRGRGIRRIADRFGVREQDPAAWASALETCIAQLQGRNGRGALSNFLGHCNLFLSDPRLSPETERGIREALGNGLSALVENPRFNEEIGTDCLLQGFPLDAAAVRRRHVRCLVAGAKGFSGLLRMMGLDPALDPGDLDGLPDDLSPREAAFFYMNHLRGPGPKAASVRRAFCARTPLFAMIPELLALKGPSRRVEFCAYETQLKPLLETLRKDSVDLSDAKVREYFIEYVRRFGLLDLPVLVRAVLEISACEHPDPHEAARRLRASASSVVGEAFRLLAVPADGMPTPRMLLDGLEAFRARLQDDLFADRLPSRRIEHGGLAMGLFNALVPFGGEYATKDDRPSLITEARLHANACADALPKPPAFLQPEVRDVVVLGEYAGEQGSDRALRLEALAQRIHLKYRDEQLTIAVRHWRVAAELLEEGYAQRPSWWFGRIQDRIRAQLADLESRASRVPEKGRRAFARQVDTLRAFEPRLRAAFDAVAEAFYERADEAPRERDLAPALLRALQDGFRDQETGKVDRRALLASAGPEAHAFMLRFAAIYAQNHIRAVIDAAKMPEPEPFIDAWTRYFVDEYLGHLSRTDAAAGQNPQIPEDLAVLAQTLFQTNGKVEGLRDAGLVGQGPAHPFLDGARAIQRLAQTMRKLSYGASTGQTVPLGIHPCMGLGRALAGDMANACYNHLRYSLIRGGYPALTALVFSLPDEEGRKIAGSVLFIDTRNSHGERALVIRALNPTEAVIQREIDAGSFVRSVTGYAIAAAQKSLRTDPGDPVREVHICYDRSGGHSTNRSTVFEAIGEGFWKQAWSRSEPSAGLAVTPETTFNDYFIHVPGQTRVIWRTGDPVGSA